MDVTPLTIFVTPKPVTKAPSGLDKLKSPASRFLADESRRPSLSGRPLQLRQRMTSQDVTNNDVDNLSELQRKLRSLDATHRDTGINQTKPISEIGDSQPNIAPSSVPSTQQERSSGLIRLARSRASFGRESTKAAPVISASADHAVGKLDISITAPKSSASAASGSNTPMIIWRHTHHPPPDLSLPYTTTYEGQDPNILALLSRTYFENPVFNLEYLGSISTRTPSSRRPGSQRAKISSKGTDNPVTLIANLTTHEKGIQNLLLPADQSYLLSVDESGLIAVWDTLRLEKSVMNKPRLSYQLEGDDVMASCGLVGRSTFAFATRNGVIQIVRVMGIGSKQAKIVTVQQIVFDTQHGSVAHLQNLKTG